MAKRTKFLTKATAENSANLVSVSGAIVKLAKALPELDNYLVGRRRTEISLPENILCFHRQSSFRLVGPSGSSSPRQHHRCILLVSLSGTGRVHIDDRCVLLQANEAILILPFQFHSYSDIAPEKRCWLFITFEQADLGELTTGSSVLHCKLDVDDLMLLRSFLQLYQSDGGNLLSLTLGLLLGRLEQRRDQNAATQMPEDDLLRAVNAQMLGNLKQSMGTKQLASLLGFSVSHLRTKFRRVTGRSLGRHLRTLRVQRACSFLYSTDETISTIADRCGFSTVYAFSRTFKNEMGVSPRTYREGQRNTNVSKL